MKKTTIAYLAGIVDGEGYVGIKKSKARNDCVAPRYCERIQVRMVDEPAIRLLSESLGGSYYAEHPHSHAGRPLFCWQVSDLQATKALKTLMPYLLIKKVQAQTVLLLRKHKERPRTKTMHLVDVQMIGRWGKEITVGRQRYTDESIEYRDSLWLRCKSLNHGGR